MLKLYDSKTKELISLPENKISIYNCGPTVYNHIHIGNARPLVVFDVLNRLLLHLKKEVIYVLNITDIDDKIINRAIEENKQELELSEFYTQQYFAIKTQLNILPMINPKVSDNIEGIIQYIEKLVDLKIAYFAEDGDVYFDVNKVSNYGCVSHQNPEELISGARVKIDSHKKSSNDFVLWKKTSNGIKWPTKWFEGRPGWHTECAYLINHLIGKQVTIHGGGMDLKFPHHENENAQNEALYGCSLAKVWLHVGMINIDNEKMSKSLNNFILVKDILNKYSYQALRWFFYQTGFANPLNYSDEFMQQMENEINKFKTTINKAKNLLIFNNKNWSFTSQIVNEIVVNHLCDNLNLINAITEVYNINKQLNIYIRQNDVSKVEDTLNELISTLNILGITFEEQHTDKNIELLQLWKAAHDKKDFKIADEYRKELMAKGIL